MSALRTCSLAALLTVAMATSAVAQSPLVGDPVDTATGLAHPMLPGLPLLLPGADEEFGTADDVLDTALNGDVDVVVRVGAAGLSPLPAPQTEAEALAAPVVISDSGGVLGASVDFTVAMTSGPLADQTVPLLGLPDLDGRPVAVMGFADLDDDGFIGPVAADGSVDDALELAEASAYIGRQGGTLDAGRLDVDVSLTVGAPASMGGLAVVLAAGAYTGSDQNFLYADGTAVFTQWPFFPPLDPTRVFVTNEWGGAPTPPDPNGTIEIQFRPEWNYLPAPDDPLLAGAFAIPVGSAVANDHVRVISGPAVAAGLHVEADPATFVASVDSNLRPAPGLAGGRSLVVPLGDVTSMSGAPLRLLPLDALGNVTDPDGGGFTARLDAVDGVAIVSPDLDGDTTTETVTLADAAGAVIVLDDAAAGPNARVDVFAVTTSRARGAGRAAAGRMVGSARVHADANRDGDGDGVLDDGDGSGIAGDNLCRGGVRDGCDDNCPEVVNPSQRDLDGDGVGDCCEGLCRIDAEQVGCAECPSVSAVFIDTLAASKTAVRRARSGGGERVRIGFEIAVGAGAAAWGAETIRVRVSAGGDAVYEVAVGAERTRRSAGRLLYRDGTASERGLRRLVVRRAADGRLIGALVADGIDILGAGAPPPDGGAVVEVAFDGDAYRGFAACPKRAARGWRCTAR